MVASVLIIGLGLLHSAFTFNNYNGISYEAVWFLGTGIAIVLAGFVNVAMLRDGGRDTVIWSMALLTNVVFLLGFSAAAYIMREPQVFIGAALFLVTTVYTLTVNPGTEPGKSTGI